MDMSLGNQSHCFRALNGRATLCGAVLLARRSLALPFLLRVLSDNSGERTRLACWQRRLAFADFSTRLFRRDAETNTRDACAIRKL
jgi:hypothetical protein